MANACCCRETASLREIADVVEQLFTIAATCDLRNVTPEDREAAIHAFKT